MMVMEYYICERVDFFKLFSEVVNRMTFCNGLIFL